VSSFWNLILCFFYFGGGGEENIDDAKPVAALFL